MNRPPSDSTDTAFILDPQGKPLRLGGLTPQTAMAFAVQRVKAPHDLMQIPDEDAHRVAEALMDALPKGYALVRLGLTEEQAESMHLPAGVKPVLMSNELWDMLGASRVDWGEPDEMGFYVPTVYRAPVEDGDPDAPTPETMAESES